MKNISDLDFRTGDIVQIKTGDHAGKLGKIERITPGAENKPFLVYTICLKKDDGIEYLNAMQGQFRFVSRG